MCIRDRKRNAAPKRRLAVKRCPSPRRLEGAAVVVVVAVLEAAPAEAERRSSRPKAYRITNLGVSSYDGTSASSSDGLVRISSRVSPTVTVCLAHSMWVTEDGDTATHLPPSQLLVSITR